MSSCSKRLFLGVVMFLRYNRQGKIQETKVPLQSRLPQCGHTCLINKFVSNSSVASHVQWCSLYEDICTVPWLTVWQCTIPRPYVHWVCWDISSWWMLGCMSNKEVNFLYLCSSKQMKLIVKVAKYQD